MGGQFLQEPPPPEARLTQPSNPKFFKSVSKTIEEHAEHLKGSPIEIIQISRGEFNGRSTVLDLGGITLANRHANAQYIGQGAFTDMVTLLFPLQDKSYYTDGLSCSKNNFSMKANNDAFKVVFPENFEHLGVFIHTSMFSKYLADRQADEIFEFLKTHRNQTIYETDGFPGRYMHNLFINLASLYEAAGPIPIDPTIYKKMIINFLYEYFCLIYKPVKQKKSNHGRIVQRGIELIEASDEIIPLKALTSELHASERTIHNAFASVLNSTPHQIIKAHFLHKIRDCLLRTNLNASQLNLLLLTRFVTNFSRFKQEYRDYLHESPKDTMNRLQRLAIG